MTRTYKPVTVRQAYYRGYKSTPEYFDDALVQFTERYCAHPTYAGMCELCRAYHNGLDDQANYERHEHAKVCPLGFGDADNHENCGF
jgi:hypothetical protein